MQKWEYRVVFVTVETMMKEGLHPALNKQGDEGWELTFSEILDDSEGNQAGMNFIFKRPKK